MGNYWGTTQENSSITYYLLGARNSSETPRSEGVLDLLWAKVLLMAPVPSACIRAGTV
jgi:hypothetical protein